MAGEVFRSTFTVNELVKAATVDVVAGEITRIGEYKVQAGEQISIGSGQLAGQDNATGRIYMVFKDNAGAPVQMSGSVRLECYSAQNRPVEILNEWRTEDLATSDTDRTLMIPLPEHALWMREDQRLVLNFIGDAGGVGSGTLAKANCKFLISMTKKVL